MNRAGLFRSLLCSLILLVVLADGIVAAPIPLPAPLPTPGPVSPPRPAPAPTAAPLVKLPGIYNGIVLPKAWPPQTTNLTEAPMPVPYLAKPPTVIPIDIGRQLFIDDFLISDTTLKRTWHAAEWHTNNPVLQPDRPWETNGGVPCAMVRGDGVWFDRTNKVFKMWYTAGGAANLCYATSTNGFDWEKPALDVVRDTNIVLPGEDGGGAATVWCDEKEPNANRRFKLFRYGKERRLRVYASADGIHWGQPIDLSGPCGEGSSVSFNPFREQWVFNLRAESPLGHARRYLENPDLLAGLNWNQNSGAWWVGADRFDLPSADVKSRAELYDLNLFPYESVMVGLFALGRGAPAERPLPHEFAVGFSRDGFHWDRENRNTFIPPAAQAGDWNWSSLQSAGGGCLVVARKLFFYVGGRTGVAGKPDVGAGATGLATLRRDGFASMDTTNTTGEGILTTRPVEFTGKRMFLNVDCPNGELRMDILDESGQVIKLRDQTGKIYALDAEHCTPLKTDSTLVSMNWSGVPELTALAGRPVRFRFHLTNGRLYSFWLSNAINGSSRGYVAAGGPNFTHEFDSVGTLSYRPINATNAPPATRPILSQPPAAPAPK